MDDIELPDEMAGTLQSDNVSDWANIVSMLFAQRGVGAEIEEIAFKYLQPEIEGLNVNETRAWMREHAPIDGVARLFACLMVPDAMLKKNVKYLLNLIYQEWIPQPSMHISMKSSDGPSTTLIPQASSAFN